MRRFDGDRLLFATHNAGKAEEVAALLAPAGIAVLTNRHFDLGEPDETESTFEGNALIKAHAAMGATGLPVLADDSGIEIDGLDGAPGVRTADWAETGGGRDFVMAMGRAHRELVDRGVPEPWTARFRAVMAVLWPDGHAEVVDGRCEGRVVWPMRGAVGHGYDPMFVPAGETRTFAEMTFDEKNARSHRGAALRALAPVFGLD
ncbi:non-canonical purine NTP pyrophosphatase [Jannaschia sp. Os4]|uniref:non-canonical purine NTP pyrophosphatase n=1 Tax=Jannaschia sp. Os4 TaxID=2807617 RepID=UPI00193A2618|nr:non-canonical purine NTP pyrophosphatase [Jannaschia sp. Os4]